MEWKNKHVIIVGLGKSGLAVAELLKKSGAKICFYDGNKEADISNLIDPVYLGRMPEDLIKHSDLAVFSPGVPLDIPFADLLRKKKVSISGEIEVSYSFEKGTLVGITGTNGKTTTTTLVGEILKAYNENTFVVGNIGTPYAKLVNNSSEDSVTVAEISSFQLETVKEFHPAVSAILNITPDHLNRHKTMENYIRTKCDITKNQTREDVCVLNYEDDELRRRSRDMSCQIAWFSSKQKVEHGVYLDQERNLVYADQNEIICNVSECQLLGIHNHENYMAAICIAIHLHVPMEVIRRVVMEFRGVEHRVEFVANKNGVNYYNDSKGTNTDAAIKGIQSMNRKTVLIGGGYDKKADFTEWIESFDGKVSYLVLLGETKNQIAETAENCGFHSIVMVEDLKEAVERASKLAKEGESVLLSPACASWDMFDSYEQRGDLFKQYVNDLE